MAFVVGLPLGVAVPLGAIGATNGGIAGWTGMYSIDVRGVVAFVLDSTWATPMTAAALFGHGVAATQSDRGYQRPLSERQNRHVYARGFRPRKGFLITLGNVVSGAGDTSSSRRQRLITDHENVHVWQARWFGPLYPLLYGGWMLAGGIAGAVLWAIRPSRAPLPKMIESCAYHLNPFEWWAYSRDDHWPPKGKVPGLGWKRPLVRPFRPGGS